MSLKTWLSTEKQDLDKRIRSYSRFRLTLLFSIILGFFVSVFWLWQKTLSWKIQTYDQTVFVFIEKFKTLSLLKFFSLVTYLGDAFFIVASFLILVAVLIIKRRKRAAAVSFLSLVGSAILVSFFKHLFGRTRPFGCLLPDDCLSFPSGHATLAFYFYGLLDYLIFRFLPISWKSFIWITFGLGTLVALIALSRLFLGLHYFSDILGGFFLGGSWLLLAILLIDFLY